MFILKPKTLFFLKNLIRGLVWLAGLVSIFYLIKTNISLDFAESLKPIYENTFLVFLVYSISELLFGIIPPEFFMFWALRDGIVADYIVYIIFLSVISYLAGFIGYLFGSYLNTTRTYRYIRRRFLGKYHSLLQNYGYFLIIVAAATPLPFSAISMLVGSLKYSMRKFLFYSLARFLRFGVYAFLIWKAMI